MKKKEKVSPAENLTDDQLPEDVSELNENETELSENETETDETQNDPRQIITQECKFILTAAELNEKIRKLVDIRNIQIPMIQSTLSLVTKRYKNEIEELENEAIALGNTFIAKHELRKTDCMWHYNPKTKQMDLIRLSFENPDDKLLIGDECFEEIKNSSDCTCENWQFYPKLVIETRSLTPDEQQLQLELDKKTKVKESEDQPESAKNHTKKFKI